MADEELNAKLERLQQTQDEIVTKLKSIRNSTSATHNMVQQIIHFIWFVILAGGAIFLILFTGWGVLPYIG